MSRNRLPQGILVQLVDFIRKNEQLLNDSSLSDFAKAASKAIGREIEERPRNSASLPGKQSVVLRGFFIGKLEIPCTSKRSDHPKCGSFPKFAHCFVWEEVNTLNQNVVRKRESVCIASIATIQPRRKDRKTNTFVVSVGWK
jgi:hypothetical protein